MDYKLIINKVENGYILSYEDELNDETKIVRKIVIQEDESDELKAHEEMLWQVIEYFGFYGSKHDKERIRVIREGQGNDN